jgi:GNAT superfamily N-acetyltransferase
MIHGQIHPEICRFAHLPFKVSSLRSLVRLKSQYQIRTARNDDWLEIERLLDSAPRNYLALEWWTLQEWLGSPTFLLISDRNKRSAGLMLTVAGNSPIAWLRAISVDSDAYLLPLLQASSEAVQTLGGVGLAYLGDQGWIQSKLRQADFKRVNRVVTLRHIGSWRMHEGPSGLQVREVTPADIDLILAADHAAFSPMWWYSHKILSRAVSLASSFDIALLDDECVGYQLCTLRNARGHIVRLAVHPNWQRLGIGARLLSEAIRSLHEAGAQRVTVNTQEDNYASLELYRRFAFEPVGKPWGVWYRSLEQE